MKALALLLAATLSMASARTWTSSDGKSLEAKFVSATETHVTLKLSRTGKKVTIPLTRLSEDDQKFIKDRAEKPEAEATELTGEYAHLVTGDWVKAEHKNLPYCFYGGKDLNGSSKVPLVISLHGKSSNNENGKQIGFARSFVNGENYKERPCLVLAPLCYQPHGETGGGWDDAPGEETLSLVKNLLKELPIIDKDRVYVIGYSMGGFGTWHFLKEEPKIFAAGVPVAGGTSGAGKLRSMPIWSFHGAKDKIVPPTYARNCAEDLKRSKVFKYTEFPDDGHGIIGKVVNDPELHTWLFEQSKSKGKK